MWLLLSFMSTREALLHYIGNKYSRPSVASIPSPPLLRATSRPIDVTFDSKSIEASFHVSTRDDTRNEMRHCELYSKKLWFSWLMRFLPKWWPVYLRPKPCAKAGVRTYTTPAVGHMNDIINDLFFNNRSSNDGLNTYTSSNVGILVYMWVKPSLRGCRIGDFLLFRCAQTLRAMGASHMLLVHDDNGCGKLINFYIKRGFQPIFSYLEKAMIGKL